MTDGDLPRKGRSGPREALRRRRAAAGRDRRGPVCNGGDPHPLQLHAAYGTVALPLKSATFSVIGRALPAHVRALNDGGHTWALYALAIGATLVAVRRLRLAPPSAR
ncbi:hypothetical protein ACWCV9_22585 [Streptomyces sp. NPDC001606]